MNNFYSNTSIAAYSFVSQHFFLRYDLRSSLICYVDTLPVSANLTTVKNFLFGDFYPKNENPQQICMKIMVLMLAFHCHALVCFKNVY